MSACIRRRITRKRDSPVDGVVMVRKRSGECSARISEGETQVDGGLFDIQLFGEASDPDRRDCAWGNPNPG